MECVSQSHSLARYIWLPTVTPHSRQLNIHQIMELNLYHSPSFIDVIRSFSNHFFDFLLKRYKQHVAQNKQNGETKNMHNRRNLPLYARIIQKVAGGALFFFFLSLCLHFYSLHFALRDSTSQSFLPFRIFSAHFCFISHAFLS